MVHTPFKTLDVPRSLVHPADDVGVRNTGGRDAHEAFDASRPWCAARLSVCAVFRTRRPSGSLRKRAVHDATLEQDRDGFDVLDLVVRYLEETGIEDAQVGRLADLDRTEPVSEP